MDRAAAKPDGRRSRWETHRAIRREELIAAVIAVVRAEGAGVGMDDIAVHSGIAKPVYYRYFSDKADLHLAVGQTVARQVVHEVTAALDRAGTPRSKLTAGIDAYLRAIESEPQLYQFVTHTIPTRRAAKTDPVEDYATVAGLHAARIIGDLLRESGGDAGAAEPWGFGLVGMVRAAADRWLEHPAITRSALAAYLTDLVEPGLTAVLPGVMSTPDRTPFQLAGPPPP